MYALRGSHIHAFGWLAATLINSVLSATDDPYNGTMGVPHLAPHIGHPEDIPPFNAGPGGGFLFPDNNITTVQENDTMVVSWVTIWDMANLSIECNGTQNSGMKSNCPPGSLKS